MEGRRERKARLKEESEQRVALAARYKGMSLAERVAEARREDLTEDEQLALATFANDPEIEEALLTNRNLESTPQFIAEAVAREQRRSALPWWRRIWTR